MPSVVGVIEPSSGVAHERNVAESALLTIPRGSAWTNLVQEGRTRELSVYPKWTAQMLFAELKKCMPACLNGKDISQSTSRGACFERVSNELPGGEELQQLCKGSKSKRVYLLVKKKKKKKGSSSPKPMKPNKPSTSSPCTQEVKESTRKHVRRRLEAEFGEGLHFVAVEEGKRKMLVIPDNLTVVQLARENVKLQEKQTLIDKAIDNEHHIIEAALCIREKLKTLEVNSSWPPKPSELHDSAIDLPDCLLTFLRIVLTGNTDSKKELSLRVQRLIKSFGQDFIYGLEEIDTALCLQKMAKASDDKAVLPENIHPHVCTSLAWDNIDRLEETLSGDGTSHRVNGIAVQPKVFGPHLPSSLDTAIEKSRKRTVTLPPTLLPVYNAGNRVGPPSRKYIEVTSETVLYNAWKKNLLWILARLHAEVNQNISSWTGFNISCRDDVTVSQDNIGYLSTIDAPATNLSTVHEVLLQSVKIKDTLLLKSIVVVFDQALYSKAVEIIWKKEEQFKDIVPRMGVFHTICTLLAVIGKRFQDAGLRDLCVEARVIAEGSVNGVLDGHRYNRAVRFHKLMYEALMRVAWKGFISWLQKFHSDKINIVQDAIDDLEGLCQNVCHEEYEKAMQSPLYFCITELFSVYLDYLRCDNGNLSGFWMTYVDMVEIMLNLIRASREGNWTLHLSAVRAMIPWCFAYNNLNYARYLTAYLSQMSHLEQEHPDVHSHLASGGFSVQIGENNPFGRIPVDQTCEETVNKDTQTPGGTKGFSLKPGAVSRYYMVAEYRSIFLSNLREMLHLKSFYGHTDLQGTRITRDEEDVKSLVDLLENTWINPFDPDTQELVSISTGKVAPPEVQEHLLLAREKGQCSVPRIQSAAHRKFSSCTGFLP
ncbi:hypothetical protein QZH41_005644 [Actinostola sp. cb2023]|nr:hypothetical protein QZH41_005644 [Actinostola sp. cb2023]